MPDTPQHNSVAKHMNRTLLNKVRSMLTDADLPEAYWYDALVYTAYIHNVSPTHALKDSTPKEAWSRNKPDISHLCIFGCWAFVHIPAAQCSKLVARSVNCTFLGHARNRMAFRLIHRPMHQFIESRDVVFDEGGTHMQTQFEHIILEDNITDTSILPVDASAPTVEAGGTSAISTPSTLTILTSSSTPSTLSMLMSSSDPQSDSSTNTHQGNYMRFSFGVKDFDLGFRYFLHFSVLLLSIPRTLAFLYLTLAYA
jgi:hypothetical protein